MMEQIEDSLRTSVTYPQFRQICKNQRRNCSVARQAINENNGSHLGPSTLTKFVAPVCRVDDAGSDDEKKQNNESAAKSKYEKKSKVIGSQWRVNILFTYS